MAELFLSSGSPIIDQQYKGKSEETFKSSADGAFATTPLFIFVNHNTASAAEIIAGALQENKRGPVIGQVSYGKGTIQLVYDLSDGSSLHVTSAKWWVPNLDPPIGGNGLQPDVTVDPDPAETANARYIQAVETILALPSSP